MNSISEKKVEFYFDFLSPYSYLAWTRIKNDSDLNLEFIPVSVPNIIAHFETKGPGQIEAKRNYLMKDLLRFTQMHNIPFTTPPTLPFNSLYGLRLALHSVSGSYQKKVIDLFFKAAWEEGLDIGNSEIVTKLLKDADLPAGDWLDKIATKEMRIELKKNSELAIAKGAFGVPTFFCEEEMFWGNDSLDYLKMYLKGRDPLPNNRFLDFKLKHPFNQ
jgi:2-hydroxychromene-2-carboxylate isomerase